MGTNSPRPAREVVAEATWDAAVEGLEPWQCLNPADQADAMEVADAILDALSTEGWEVRRANTGRTGRMSNKVDPRALKWLHAAYMEAHDECFHWRRWHSDPCRDRWMADLAAVAPTPGVEESPE